MLDYKLSAKYSGKIPFCLECVTLRNTVIIQEGELKYDKGPDQLDWIVCILYKIVFVLTICFLCFNILLDLKT